MSDDAMKALDEIEGALLQAEMALRQASRQLTEDHRIALNGRRWGGPAIDRLANALSLLPTLRAALTPPADQIRALQDAIEGECDGISVSERSACNILSYIGARAALTPPADDEVEAIRGRHNDDCYRIALEATPHKLFVQAHTDRATLLRALDAERQRRVEVEDNARLLVRDEHGFLVPRSLLHL